MKDDERQAELDASVARRYAADSLRREAEAAHRGRTPADMVEGYAMELLDQLDGSVPRALLAARAAALNAASEVAHPGRWKTAIRAAELCRRAAQLAGHRPAENGHGPAEEGEGPAGDGRGDPAGASR
jgi:hypothetical protein